MKKIPVKYVSSWDGGSCVFETKALLNVETGEITDIETVDTDGFDLNSCDFEEIHILKNSVEEGELSCSELEEITCEVEIDENNNYFIADKSVLEKIKG